MVSSFLHCVSFFSFHFIDLLILSVSINYVNNGFHFGISLHEYKIIWSYPSSVSLPCLAPPNLLPHLFSQELAYYCPLTFSRVSNSDLDIYQYNQSALYFLSFWIIFFLDLCLHNILHWLFSIWNIYERKSWNSWDNEGKYIIYWIQWFLLCNWTSI